MSSSTTATPIDARGVLSAAWPLFQVSWPVCLPLALLGVVASAVPGAEAAASPQGHGWQHDPQWWGLYAASMALMLICYGAVLVRQLSLASGAPLALREVLRRAVMRLPVVVATLVPLTLAVVAGLALLVVPGVLVLVLLGFAWHVALWEELGPLDALRRSARLARGRLLPLAGVLGAAVAAVLVFVMLTGILMGVVMSLAGIQPTAEGAPIGLARVLYGLVLAVPVVWLGAVTTATYLRVRETAP